MKIRSALAVLLMLPISVFAAENIYVQSLKADIKNAPAFSARTTATANKGEQLAVIEKSGSWYKVKRNNQEGWVFRYLVSAKPPLDKVTASPAENRELERSARRRASVVTTTAAVRGLAAEDRLRSGQKSGANYTDLDRIVEFRVSDSDAVSFIEQKGN